MTLEGDTDDDRPDAVLVSVPKLDDAFVDICEDAESSFTFVDTSLFVVNFVDVLDCVDI